jgi:ABC-type amino acid transport system permease subunit
MNMIINISAFAILTLLWLGFGAALLFNQAMLDTVWQLFRGLPLAIQIVLGLLVLPIFLGLWIWESSLPLWLRLILVIGLGVATIYTFFPKKA